jgi:hypothetical protein
MSNYSFNELYPARQLLLFQYSQNYLSYQIPAHSWLGVFREMRLLHGATENIIQLKQLMGNT